MQLYLYQDQQQVGPYSESQIREMLMNGSLQETDVCWHEQLSDWQPISSVLNISAAKAASKSPLPNAHVAEVKEQSSRQKPKFPQWVRYALPAIAALIIGYFIGREHLKYQIKTALFDVATAFSGGLRGASADSEALSTPVPQLEIGQTHQVDGLDITLESAKIEAPQVKRAYSSEVGPAEKPSLVFTVKIQNTDERKVLKYREDKFRLRDDVDNEIRPAYYSFSSERLAGALGSRFEITPGSTVSHIEAFNIPLPKTEYLVLSVDLSGFDRDGIIEYKIPASSIE